ncbi:hypothetical protein IFM89_006836 [Coptis chinensis]|uniref:Pathogenesis-related homeodomain protein n=1 Tax=Coptis chinensis TaxID=261450 RepID=A0A835I9I8_9MAGN|nr:hypothetical protein IFM89_006836 [Coptis chinensis]
MTCSKCKGEGHNTKSCKGLSASQVANNATNANKTAPRLKPKPWTRSQAVTGESICMDRTNASDDLTSEAIAEAPNNAPNDDPPSVGIKANIDMQEAGNISCSKTRIGSKRNISFQDKNSCTVLHTKKRKPKPRSHVKTIGSVFSKRKAVDLSSSGARPKSLNRKPVRTKTQSKDTDTNSSEKPLSSWLQGVKSSTDKWRGLEEATDKYFESQKIQRRRKRKKRKNGELDEASRLQRRTRYLVIKMKLEQNLIEAYSGEGWNGQSREKIKPEKELQRAKKQILKCKLGIRDAIRQLETLSFDGHIEDSVISADGSVLHEHIFCSKCKLQDAFPDNDIILCDGSCNCAFHQKCLEPPLATENIPPDDQGWFCKFCECKMEILEAINAHLGTRFSGNSKWQDIFLEASTTTDNEDASLYPEGDWPSDDSEDDDYDPERNEMSCSFSRMGSEENVSDDASSSGSLYWTSDAEDGLHSERLDGSIEGQFHGDKSQIMDSNDIYGVETFISTDSNGSTDQIAYRRRQRRDVDYKKLHDEMFGKYMVESEEISADEDWGPGRRKRRRNVSDAAGNRVALCDSDNDFSNVTRRKNVKKSSYNSEGRRKLFRIPPDAVKKLREVFAEDELPSRVVRENLSKQFGIALEKINKWFKNARYTALKIRKSSIGAGKIQGADAVASEDDPSLVSLATRVQRLRKLRRRKNSKLVTIPSRKKGEKSSTVLPTKNSDEVLNSLLLACFICLNTYMQTHDTHGLVNGLLDHLCESSVVNLNAEMLGSGFCDLP